MAAYRLPHAHAGRRGVDLERRVCRQFMNGSCRYGQRCYYLHEWPAVPSAQVCRYFQKGGCWFGDNCRYLHIPHTVTEAAVGRRGSVPAFHSSAFAGHTSTARRGSEPFAVQNERISPRRGSEPLITSFLGHQLNRQHSATHIAEEEEEAASTEAGPAPHIQEKQRCPLQSDEAGPSHSQSSNSSGALSSAASFEVQESSLQDGLESGAMASAGQERTEAYNQSKDVVCGICMDKVYEKNTEGERRFGILPNCSHSFCLGCIMKWRKTKEFQEEVIKACPQCRVKSSFYIPSKYWVCEGEPKAALIRSFKEKSSKVKCNFFLRHGCCPFASECIFSHEMPPGHRPQRRPSRPKQNVAESLDPRILSYFIALTLMDDEDFDFFFFLDDSDSEP